MKLPCSIWYQVDHGFTRITVVMLSKHQILFTLLGTHELLFSVEDIAAILIHWAHQQSWKDVFSERDDSYSITLIGKHMLALLDRSHESIEEVCHACASYYVNCYPGPSERFNDFSISRKFELFQPLSILNPFLMSKGEQTNQVTMHDILLNEYQCLIYYFVEPNVTAKRLIKALNGVAAEDWDKIGRHLYIARMKRDEIQDMYDTEAERKEALLKEYANMHSCTSWWDVCTALRLNDYQELANKVKAKYIGELCVSYHD